MENIRVILFDVDGVLIRAPQYFSAKLEQQGYANASAILNRFYGSEKLHHTLEGTKSFTDSIAPYLIECGWEHGPEQYLQEMFSFDAQYVDSAALNVVRTYAAKGIECALATDQYTERAQFLLETLNVQNIFSHQFISCDIGARKISPQFWEYVFAAYPEYAPEQIGFIDDLQTNIDEAARHGIQTQLFTGEQTLEKVCEMW